MYTCNESELKLAEYLSDNLPLDERGEIEQHLHSCSACRDELARMEAVLALVAEVSSTEDAPPQVWQGIHEQLLQRRQRRSLLPWRVPRVAGAAVAAGLAILAVMNLGGPKQEQPPHVALNQSGSSYVQGHALTAAQGPLADRITYLSVAAQAVEHEEAH